MWYLKARTGLCAHCWAAAGMNARVMTKNVTQKGKFLLFVGGERGGGGERGWKGCWERAT